MQSLDVNAGGVFCFSRGSYSGYGYEGHFIAMENLSKSTFDAVVDDIKERMAAGDIKGYSGEKIDMDDSYDVGACLNDNFIPTLIRTGKIIAIDCVEIHTGSYGEFVLR